MMGDELLLCYNKGCGAKYNPQTSKNADCQHHPGVPVFHDALKGWSCCKKRSTDFTEFLGIPGCTWGPHSNVKPPEPEKQQPSTDDVESEPPAAAPKPEEIVFKNKHIAPMERPSCDERMIRLPASVADSLRQALDKQMMQLSVDDTATSAVSTEIKKGTSCKNNACKGVYEDESSNQETCSYHPGYPVFHEGLKFWSCCQRKTTEFDNFLSQEGCTDGQHLWIKKEESEKKVSCRYDWHQTASSVTISIFAKVANPDKTWVDVNKVTAKVNIVFDGDASHFEKTFILRGVIDPAKSSVKLMGAKVEVNFKKAEPGSWASLELVNSALNTSDTTSNN